MPSKCTVTVSFTAAQLEALAAQVARTREEILAWARTRGEFRVADATPPAALPPPTPQVALEPDGRRLRLEEA